MDNTIITTNGDVIETEESDTSKYQEILLGLRILQHAKRVGWVIAEANDLYRGLKMLKVGLPFNLSDNASKALIIDYLKNASQDNVDHLTLSDGNVTVGLPYVFTIPFTGEEGKSKGEDLIRHVTTLIRDKVVSLVKAKTEQEESKVEAKVDSMLSFSESYVNNLTSDTFSPLGVSVYSCNDSTVVAFSVMDVLSFGVDQTPATYRKLFQIAHEVLRELAITATATDI